MDDHQINNDNLEQQKSESPVRRFFWIGSIIGIIAGGAAGFLYYYFVGCRTGTCPLTGNMYISILWGAIIGYLIGDMFKKKSKK